MDTHQQHEQEEKQASDEQVLQALIDEADDEVVGTRLIASAPPVLQALIDEADDAVTIVRSNTPRPLSFVNSVAKNEQASAESSSGLADFPVEAPAAPPVPEEPEQSGAPTAISPIFLPTLPEQAEAPAPEFTWLFEYGLEMDENYLNSPELLNGQALPYGPAVLKGYRIESVKLNNGQTALSLARASALEQEVWGVLYRIPRRLAERNGAQPSMLDNIYAARGFKAIPVTVQEVYRKRMVQCTTGIPSETLRADRASSAPADAHVDSFSARRLLAAARQQHLPAAYLQELAALTGLHTEEVPTLIPPRVEQNTEPLPVVAPGAPAGPEHLPVPTLNTMPGPTPRGWLLVLALYLVGVLMATLALAVMQTLGYWSQLFSASLAPLGAPWYVLLYGLLGGCVSCIMALGRSTRPTLPGFVILTWFARPFLGMALAALAYLVLSSGVVVVSAVPGQRYAICSVIAAIAGLCEGWLFFRQK